MALSNIAPAEDLAGNRAARTAHAENTAVQAGAVSWGAILAGAAAAAALSLILLILGTGLGLSSVSPWRQSGVSATTFGVSTILWLSLTQLLASGMGGYLAGRLRVKWVAVHTDEVYFRDTAHGFLAWAVASLATAALLTSVIGSILGHGVQAGAAVAGGGATVAAAAAMPGGAVAAGSATPRAESAGGPLGYFVDALFRPDMSASASASASAPAGAAAAPAAAPRSEVAEIFMNAVRTGALPADDARYLGQLVAQRTGLNQQDAQKRVNDTFAGLQTKLRDTSDAAKEAADKARKASSYAALWLFVSLLVGAFVASLAATYGGRQRDL